jgi:hypothetical protein
MNAKPIGPIQIDGANHQQTKPHGPISRRKRNACESKRRRSQSTVQAVVAIERLDPTPLTVALNVRVNLARDGKPLFVIHSDNLGNADAESRPYLFG